MNSASKADFLADRWRQSKSLHFRASWDGTWFSSHCVTPSILQKRRCSVNVSMAVRVEIRYRIRLALESKCTALVGVKWTCCSHARWIQP
jgi:hypothetical protein